MSVWHSVCGTVMPLSPARTQRLAFGTDSALAVGDHLVATTANPDATHVVDLRSWPLNARGMPGFFANSLAATGPTGALVAGRMHHPNPYRLYAFDVESAAVSPRPVAHPWPDIASVFVVNGRALLVPGGSMQASGHTPAWCDDGAVTPLPLPLVESPAEFHHQGALWRAPAPMDRVDVAALPGDEALLIWFERMFRVSPAGVTPLPMDHLFAAWEPLREGRATGIDASGRALMVVHDRLLAVDREGRWELAVPGAEGVRGAVPGPPGVWFLASEERVLVAFLNERTVAEIDLRPMRLAPRMALHNPKPVWVPSRDALLVVHARDAWEFDLGAVRALKRVGFDKLAATQEATHRRAWSRQLKAAGTTSTPLHALSPLTRGGGRVQHPVYGDGAVLHASETMHRGGRTVVATVRFEDRARRFYFVGDGWAECSFALG